MDKTFVLFISILGTYRNQPAPLDGTTGGDDKIPKYRLCPICGMKCHRNSIKRHVANHSDARPFVCFVCRKSFKRKDYWKRHMKSHNKFTQ